MPKWMKITYNGDKKEDEFKSIEYYPIKQKCRKQMSLVDKDINFPKLKKIEIDKNRSIFNYGDFRHNVLTKEMHEYHDHKVSQIPRKFFDWDDKTQFNPKYKRDK